MYEGAEMKISEMIAALTAAASELGDIEVLMATDGCGYGTPALFEADGSFRIDNQLDRPRLIL